MFSAMSRWCSCQLALLLYCPEDGNEFFLFCRKKRGIRLYFGYEARMGDFGLRRTIASEIMGLLFVESWQLFGVEWRRNPPLDTSCPIAQPGFVAPLQTLLQRRVDLVPEKTVSNPYFIEEIKNAVPSKAPLLPKNFFDQPILTQTK